MLQANTAWRNSSVMELVDSEDESWINQPKFKLNDSDSESDEFDSRIGVAYLEAVAAMKQVAISRGKVNSLLRQATLSSQAATSDCPVLALECLLSTPANDPLLRNDAPVSVQNPSQPLVTCPSPLQQTAATAAQSPANQARPTALMGTNPNATSHIPEAVSSQHPSMPTAAAPPAVSTQQMPQLAKSVLEQRQYPTARVDQPQPMSAKVNEPQPVSKFADTKSGQQFSVTRPQTAARNSLSPAVVATLEADQPLLATAEGSLPPQVAAPQMGLPPAVTTSGVDAPQLATAVHASSQPAVTQFLDMLFPPEQPQALSTKPRSSPAGSSAVSEPLFPYRHTGRSLTPDATTDVAKAPPAAPTAAGAPVIAAEAPSTAAETPSTAADSAAPTATNDASRAPLAAALHLPRPPMVSAAASGTVADAAIAAATPAAAATAAATSSATAAATPAAAGAAAAATAAISMTTTDAHPGVSSVSEAVHSAQAAAIAKPAVHPAKAPATPITEPAAASSMAVSKLSQLAQQLALALAQAAIQLVQDQQQQQNLRQQPTQQPQQQQQPQPPKQQQQQLQSQQLQQEQQQESSAATPSRELVAASRAGASVSTLAACLAMAKPALSCSGLLPVSAVPMATDTPEAAAALFPPVMSSASAASAPAPPATMLPSYSPAQKLSAVQSGGGTWTEAVTWPGSGSWPGSQTHKQPLLQAAVPPVRLGPPPPAAPVPAIPVAPALQPPPTAWPQLPAWPSQWPPHLWGQPAPAPASQYQRPVIAPPAPPPGGPPPPPTSNTAAPLPPPLPMAPSHLPSQPQKRKGLSQQQRPAAKRQKAFADSSSRPPQQAANTNSGGSANSNSKEGQDPPGSFLQNSSGVAGRSSGGGHPANTAAARSSGRPGQRVRQRLRRQSQLAGGAQQAHADASGKATPGMHAAPHGQGEQGQLAKSRGNKGKSNRQARKAAQRARKGAHNKQGYIPQKQYPK